MPGDTFVEKDSYWAGGPDDPYDAFKGNVKTMNNCKRSCNKNPKCTAFHYYLLDPLGQTNCWIWTKEGYEANGSTKAYCFVKKDNKDDSDEVSDDDDNNAEEGIDKNHSVPQLGM